MGGKVLIIPYNFSIYLLKVNKKQHTVTILPNKI